MGKRADSPLCTARSRTRVGLPRPTSSARLCPPVRRLRYSRLSNIELWSRELGQVIFTFVRDDASNEPKMRSPSYCTLLWRNGFCGLDRRHGDNADCCNSAMRACMFKNSQHSTPCMNDYNLHPCSWPSLTNSNVSGEQHLLPV